LCSRTQSHVDPRPTFIKVDLYQGFVTSRAIGCESGYETPIIFNQSCGQPAEKNMSSKAGSRILGVMMSLYSVLGMAAADPYQLNLPEPQTEIARQIYDQHTMVLWICLVIFIGVFG